MIYYRRRSPELWEEVAAAAVGAAAGLAVYYVARALLGRDALPAPHGGGRSRRTSVPDEGAVSGEAPDPEDGSVPRRPATEGRPGSDASR